MKNWLCKCIVVILTLCFVCASSALCENRTWNCTECGRTGNTGNYCGGCAHPAPWIGFGFGFPMEDFEANMELLINQAKAWTQKNAPQTLYSFPLQPDAVFKLFENINKDTVTFEKKESQYLVHSSMHDLVIDWLGQSFDDHKITMEYFDENNQYQVTELHNTDDYNFTVELPANHENDEIRMSWKYSWNDLGGNLSGTFAVVYFVQQGIIKEDFHVEFDIYKSKGFFISWYPSYPVHQGTVTNAIVISIYSIPLNKSWVLQYDSNTKKLDNITSN